MRSGVPAGPYVTGDTVPLPVLCCDVFFSVAGTYVTFTAADAAANGVVVAAVATAIESARRDGKTVKIIGACPGQPGLDGTTAMGVINCNTYVDAPSYAAAGTVYAALTDNTLIAQHAQTLLVAGARPVGMQVAYTLA